MIIYFLSVIFLFSSHFLESTQADVKKSKSVIGEALTPMNALFSRRIYEKDEKGYEAERQTTARTLLILLDDLSAILQPATGVTTNNAMGALLQQPCPILISELLLRAIFNHQDANDFWSELIKQFNPHAWLIKVPQKIDGRDNSLFLMIPKTYIVKKAQLQGFQEINFDGLMSNTRFDLDQLLGLRISRMSDVTNLRAPWKKMKLGSVSFAPTKSAFIQLLLTAPQSTPLPIKAKAKHEFFLAPWEYKRDSIYLVPQWNILMMGHGNEKEICNIPNESFKKFINLLATEIITKLFVYVSCYSSGSNRVQVYEEITKYSGLTYAFPIIAKGIGEIVATGCKQEWEKIQSRWRLSCHSKVIMS